MMSGCIESPKKDRLDFTHVGYCKMEQSRLDGCLISAQGYYSSNYRSCKEVFCVNNKVSYATSPITLLLRSAEVRENRQSVSI